MRATSRFIKAETAIATARNDFPVPAGPIAKAMSLLRMASTGDELDVARPLERAEVIVVASEEGQEVHIGSERNAAGDRGVAQLVRVSCPSLPRGFRAPGAGRGSPAPARPSSGHFPSAS